MHRARLIALLLSGLLLSSSCAALIKGTHDTLSLQTQPPGATYELSTGESGTTPAQIEARAKKGMTVTYRLDGHEPRTVQLEREIRALGWANFAWLTMGLLGAGVAFGVDFGTGAAWKFVQPGVVQLAPKGQS